MMTNENKLMARKKRKSKVIKLQPSMSLSKYIRNYGRTLKIHEVLCNDNIFVLGSGTIFVARQKRNGDIINCSYLVDLFCLGVKDTHYELMTAYEYQDFIDNFIEMNPYNFESIDPNYGFNIIYGAVEYAEDLGIDPHKDFAITEHLLDAPEDLEFIDITFGQNGKPAYYAHEGDKKGEILRKLDKSVGPDGYTYINGYSPMDDDFDFNEMDDLNFEELDFNPIDDIVEFSKMRFDQEDDRHIYLFFTTLISILDSNYHDKLNELQNLYHHNPDKITDIIKDKLEINENQSEFNTILISSVEKYLIYQDCYFLFDEVFLEAFDSTDDMHLPHVISSVNISMAGDEKIQGLINIFTSVYSDVYTINAKTLREMIDTFNTEKSHFDYDANLIFIFITDHEDYFGGIDFDKFDFDCK